MWMIFIILALIVPISAEASCSGSGMSWSCTAGSTPTQVQSAINSATSGGTVTLQAGAYSWAGSVAVTNKSITIQGAGSTSTVITPSITSSVFDVSLNSDLAVRITGIGFEMGTTGNDRKAVSVQNTVDSTTGGGSTIHLTQVRIDHNKITGGGRYSIWMAGVIFGVIDHNECVNVDACIFTSGNSHMRWVDTWGSSASSSSPGPSAGTASMLFIEDNTFTLTAAHPTSQYDAQVYLQEGPTVVTRYNTFTCSGAGNPDSVVLNDHANQNYGTYPPYSNDLRGMPLHEVYNNTVNCSNFNAVFGLRGGSLLIHDNAITCSPCGNIVQFSEEEAWQGAFFSPLRTVWPAQDQIHNTFIWNNTLNGSAYNVAEWDNDCGASHTLCAPFIQEDRDYWLHAPQSTGGREYFSGRPGGSTASPTTGDGGTMVFTASGANQYYPYTPYTYPHPLQGASDTTPPSAPSGLYISQRSTD